MPKTFIIAEAGVNHNGSLAMALQLVDAAKVSGADAVKFQTFQAAKLATPSAGKAEYQQRNGDASESQLEMLRRLELDAAAHEKLITHCNKTGIMFLSSPFDSESADMLAALNVSLLKIPSGEITNIPFLEHLARIGKPLILSTGMSTLGEVEEAVDVLHKGGTKNLTLLHCVTEYPAPFDEVNLRVMQTLKMAFGLPVGYSDHTPGIEVATAAVALGAEMIEKHFTLDRTLPGPDHKASLEPNELREMVTAIRHVESALGTSIKSPTKCELSNLAVARKSLVAGRPLPKGHQIRKLDLEIKRPGGGIAPKCLSAVVGRTLRVDIAKDEAISWDQLK